MWYVLVNSGGHFDDFQTHEWFQKLDFTANHFVFLKGDNSTKRCKNRIFELIKG